MDISKEITKNRRGFVRYLFSLKSRWKSESPYCVYCAKAQAVFFCTGQHGIIGFDGNIPQAVKQQLNLTPDQYNEMERRFEGWNENLSLSSVSSASEHEKRFKQHDYRDIAEWCQTLPGWPKVI